MRSHSARRLGLAGLCAASLLGTQAPAEAPSQTRFNAWIVYFRASQSLAALERWGPQLNEISVFAMQFDDGGALVPASGFVQEAVSRTRQTAPRARLLLTLVNDTRRKEKDPAIVHRVLGETRARRAHVAQIVALSESVDGIDVDYERVAAADAEAFTAFVRELAQALHARGKYLSVVLEPKTQDKARPIDWKAVGQAADRIRIMAYNYAYEGTPPGSISPPDQVLALAAYAKSLLPAGKVEIALPLHGYDWPEGGKGKQINALSDILALAERKKAEIQRDSATGAPHFTYQDEAGTAHQVWYEDPVSLAQKAKLLQAQGILNIGIWELGSGDASGLFHSAR